MISYAQQNAPFAVPMAVHATNVPVTSFGAGPNLGVPQSELPQSSYPAPQAQQTMTATATNSNISLGLSAFFGALDMMGISPLTLATAVTTAPTIASTAAIATAPAALSLSLA